jgi:hypothetical protein
MQILRSTLSQRFVIRQVLYCAVLNSAQNPAMELFGACRILATMLLVSFYPAQFLHPEGMVLETPNMHGKKPVLARPPELH